MMIKAGEMEIGNLDYSETFEIRIQAFHAYGVVFRPDIEFSNKRAGCQDNNDDGSQYYACSCHFWRVGS